MNHDSRLSLYDWQIPYLLSGVRDEVLRDIEVNLYDFLEENFGKKEYTEEEMEKQFGQWDIPEKLPKPI